jgi:hypothetical protein
MEKRLEVEDDAKPSATEIAACCSPRNTRSAEFNGEEATAAATRCGCEGGEDFEGLAPAGTDHVPEPSLVSQVLHRQRCGTKRDSA